MSAMEEPKMKKQKAEKEAEEEEEQGESEAKALEKNEQGEAFLELSKMKRLTVRTFKGNVLIDIREVRIHSMDIDGYPLW